MCDKVVAIGAHCARAARWRHVFCYFGSRRCCIGLCLRRRSAARAARHLSMPPKKRRGSGWERRPRRSDAPAESPTKPESAPSDHSTGDMQHAEGTEKIVRWRKVLDFATDLWCSDYKPFMQAERARARDVMETLEHNSYRRRLKGEKAAEYDRKQERKLMNSLANFDRACNQQSWTFSQVAKSCSWYNQRVPARVWKDAVANRQVASRDSAHLVFQEMGRVEKPVPFTRSPVVTVCAADQTFMWRGMKKRQQRFRTKAGAPFRPALRLLSAPAALPTGAVWVPQRKPVQTACLWRLNPSTTSTPFDFPCRTLSVISLVPTVTDWTTACTRKNALVKLQALLQGTCL